MCLKTGHNQRSSTMATYIQEKGGSKTKVGGLELTGSHLENPSSFRSRAHPKVLTCMKCLKGDI
jgi:hypothetical protein